MIADSGQQDRQTGVRDDVSNPFDGDAVARRYSRGRLYYHRAALSLAARQLGFSHARLAVDVACGTGLSTRAVLELADHVVAFDAAVAMLRAAPAHPRVRYLVAAAERVPLRDASADLATVAAAFHWFDQPRAFAELARILRAGAGLAVYSDFFRGQLAGQPGFASWVEGAYLRRYPTPPRHPHFDPVAALPAGFRNVRYAEEAISIPLTRSQLADYLLSQSNAAVAIESGAISAGALRSQILEETAPYFPGPQPAEAVFGIRLWTATRT